MQRLKKKMLLLLLSLVLLLAGCGETGPDPTQQTTTAPVITYTVRYTVLDYIHAEYTVEQGACPAKVMDTPEGVRILGWTDAQGNEVDPLTVPVTADVEYNAIAYPALTNHAPYLLVDDKGFLHPDETLTADQLQQALQALAAPGAQEHFPGMPTGATPLKTAQLTVTLARFFPETAVADAFAEAGQTVTRAQFAAGMHKLLERNNAELLTLTEGGALPADVTLEREDAICLLEASVPHTPEENGGTWLQINLPSAYEPGLVNIDGYLYCVQEDGYFLRSGTVGTLTFGEDGRYTSGDAALDTMVAQILADIQTAAPDAERLDWLRSAYEYCRDSFTYRRRESYTKGQTGWETEDAKTMFETTKGNCYNFAAAFWALARGLGYEARAVSGTCLKDEQPHGWVFIEIDGEDYLFDPEWEYVYRYEREDLTKDMFMLPMSKIAWWNYRW